MAKPNQEQKEIMEHALGVATNLPGYRNNYCCAADDEMMSKIVAAGWMVKRNLLNGGKDAYFSVTRRGAKAIGLDPAIIRTKESPRKRAKKATPVETPQDQ